MLPTDTPALRGATRRSDRTFVGEGRRHRDRETRLLAIAHGAGGSCQVGLREHDRLALTGRRTSSKVPKLIELAMTKLLVSAGVVTKVLEVTRQATWGIVAELGLREMTGGKSRARGIV